MKEASEALKGSALLKSAGSDAPDAGGSAWDKVEKMAREFVEKSDGTLSMEQARIRVMDSNPKLYQEYLSEHPSQTARR